MLINRPTRVFHTLHRKPDRLPFVLHITQPDETSKTTLLAFTIQKDAVMMGNIFEAYHRKHGNYPPNHFTYERPFEITFDNEKEEILYTAPLQELTVEDTEEDDIYTFCASNYMDLMLIHDLTEKAKLQLITFEAPTDLFRNKFEENFK